MTRKISFVCSAVLAVWTAAADWPSWRGPEDTGAARENAVVTSWSPEGEGVLWRQDFGGRNTPIVLDGRVYFNAPVDEHTPCSQERVLCLDADTGRVIWEKRFGVFHTDIVEDRVGWTSLVADPATGCVYCHATSGELLCWDRDGNLVWKRSLTEEFGRISGYGGRLFNPILDEDRVIISFANSSWGEQARGGHRILALDKRTGEVAWWADPAGKPPQDTTYATPVVAVIDGQRLLIAPNADGWVYALRSRTGEVVWKFQLSKLALNSSPVVDGNYVYVAHGEENVDTTVMGRLVCIDGRGSGDITKSNEVWRVDGLGMGYASPAVARGRVYAVDNSANLICVDGKNGHVYWQYSLGRVGKGSPVVTADGVIYVGEQNGIFHILRDAGDHVEPLSRYEFPAKGGAIDEFFGSPAVCGGRVYFMTRYHTYCLGRADEAVSERPAAVVAAETDHPGEKPARTLIFPADVTLRPGEKVSFQLRPYTNFGRGVHTAVTGDAREWSLAGLKGAIDDDGTLTIAADSPASAGLVKARWIGEEAAARVRVVPALPLEETFDALKPDAVPAGWVAAGGRVKVAEKGGTMVLAKIASKERPSPPFMRMQTYITPPIEAGYTVVSDMMSEERDAGRASFLPDMGLVNDRYVFMLMGADRTRGARTMARIETWGAVPRLRKDVEFTWEPGVWYRVKFEVLLDGGKARCRAKVWPRTATEPPDWSIELTDDCPHAEGSAGLYCYSNGTTSRSDGPATYFDNVKVHRNE